MIQKALIIVPHEDDEINLVGTIIDQLVSSNVLIKVVFVTNGDFESDLTEQRIQEAIYVTKKMQFDDVYFLGYGDNADGSDHIFCSRNVLYKSRSGHTCTYGVKGNDDYRYLISGVHSEYRLECLKVDMQECIMRERADLIFCVDHDSHPDHRMTSLIFDQVIRDIVLGSDYRPIVLKKFAYAGTWHGRADYFNDPMLPTILDADQYFPYARQQEIRIKVNRTLYPTLFWQSNVYKWCRIYRSQGAIDHFWNIVNADSLFFYRDTNNLAPAALITTSSGEGKYLNDFKLFDTDIVCGKIKLDEETIKRYTWIPSHLDTKKKFEMHFSNPISVKMMAFHQSHDENSRIKRIKVEMNNSFIKEYELGDSLYASILLPIKQSDINQISISVLEHSGNLAGFREVEIFDHISEFPWESVPFVPYLGENQSYPRKFCHTMQKVMDIHAFINNDLKANGILYFIKRFFLNRRKRK